MNDADRLFIDEHRNHIYKTLGVISSATEEGEPGEAARIGVATLLMNVYSGMEVILRHIMEDRGAKIPKTGAWHKEILSNAVSMSVISPELQSDLLVYLQFCHRHMHGYGYMLEWEKLKPLAYDIGIIVDKFFSELKQKDCWWVE